MTDTAATQDQTADDDTTAPLGFYLLVECGNCDEDIYYGPCVSFLGPHRGLPVVSYDMAATTRFDCDHCGAENYTGDFELYTEARDDPDELDEDGDETGGAS